MPSVCAYDNSIRSFMERPLDQLKADIHSSTTPIEMPSSVQDKVAFISEHRDHIPGLLAAFSAHMNADALFMPYDNGLLVCFNEQVTTDNVFSLDEELLEFVEKTSSPETARNLFAALGVGTTIHEKEFGSNEFLSLTFPPELGMTKELQTQWLKNRLSTLSRRVGASFDIYNDAIEPNILPAMETLTLESSNGEVTIQAAQTGHDEALYVIMGIPMLRRPVAPGEGLLINVLKHQDEAKYFFSLSELPEVLTDDKTLKSLSETMLKAEGYGDIDLGFDPLSRRDRLKSFGLDDISDLTPELMNSWDDEKRSDFVSNVLSANETYNHPDIHFRNEISYVAALSQYGVTQTRSISLSKPTMERIDMWVDACKKAVKAGSLEESSDDVKMSSLFGVGVLQRAPTDGKDYKAVTWELSSTNNKPVFFIDLEQAKNWSSQKMLSEAIRAVSGVKTHLYKQAGKAYSQREDIFQMFGSVAQDDYLDIRGPLRKKLSGNVVGVNLTPDENSDARHLANMLMSWTWPQVDLETYRAPDITESAIIIEAPEETPQVEPEVLPPPLGVVQEAIPITALDIDDKDTDPFGWGVEETTALVEEAAPTETVSAETAITPPKAEVDGAVVSQVEGETVPEEGLGEWWDDMESAFMEDPQPSGHPMGSYTPPSEPSP